MSERRAGSRTRAVLDAACSEADLMAQVVALARLQGFRVYHTHDSRRSAAGFPDLVLVHPSGRLLFAELKSERGRLSMDQADWLCLLRHVPGVEVCLWRPSDWAEIERELQRTPVAVEAGGRPGGAPAREAAG